MIRTIYLSLEYEQRVHFCIQILKERLFASDTAMGESNLYKYISLCFMYNTDNLESIINIIDS